MPGLVESWIAEIVDEYKCTTAPDLVPFCVLLVTLDNKICLQRTSLTFYSLTYAGNSYQLIINIMI